MNISRWVTTIIRFLFIALVIVFFVWAFRNGYFGKIFNQPDKFLLLLKQHLKIVGLSSFIAIVMALLVGILVTRKTFRRIQWPFMFLANLGQTLPSLAVLALAMGYLGLGFKPAVFALFIYSVLPILRNTVAGIDSISNDLIDSAKGMGMKPHQILFRIELPNAAYSIMAGIRTSVVINIGTAALAFLIGAGGLGNWINTGISLVDNSYLLSGAVPLTLLALAVDFLFRLAERIVVPKSLRKSITDAS
ncbi:ABC transporter permease [Lentibacillus halophilus]|uniref:ABC transporter permease n=1 Tax=Lentibacillus halophilus TaxID=295065 RepID=A0ABP3IYN5_9BACI